MIFKFSINDAIIYVKFWIAAPTPVLPLLMLLLLYRATPGTLARGPQAPTTNTNTIIILIAITNTILILIVLTNTETISHFSISRCYVY